MRHEVLKVFEDQSTRYKLCESSESPRFGQLSEINTESRDFDISFYVIGLGGRFIVSGWTDGSIAQAYLAGSHPRNRQQKSSVGSGCRRKRRMEM
jgi:hypothetical protein